MAFAAQVALAAVWGGLLALERRAFLQAMLSRPLVASTLTGLLLNDVEGGLFVGLVFELFWLGAAALGGAVEDLETLPAVMGGAFVAMLGHATGGRSTAAMWTLTVLLFAPFGRIGRVMEKALDARARRYGDRAKLLAHDGELKRAVRQNLRAMWPHFVLFGALTGMGAAAGVVVSHAWGHLPIPALRGLAWCYPAAAACAAAVAVRGSHARRAPQWALAAAAVVIGASALVAFGGAPTP